MDKTQLDERLARLRARAADVLGELQDPSDAGGLSQVERGCPRAGVRGGFAMSDEDQVITPEMRARADATVDELRRRWAARDAQTGEANRAFDVAFRKALRKSRDVTGETP